MQRLGWTAAAVVVLGLAGEAHAVKPADKCESAKNQEAGKYAFCRQKAEAKYATTGDAAALATAQQKCLDKYNKKWPTIESKAGGACPSTGDQAAIQGAADQYTDNIATALAGGTLPAAPPSQPLRTGQTQCDQGAETLGACPGSPSGQDGTTLKGQTRSYTVNGNGTITDNKTGLVWEQLDDNNANGIHDYSALFTWYDAYKKIQVLNGNVAGCIAANNPDACCTGAGTGSCAPFAGQTDWRLPNQFELYSLADLGRFNPAINPAFNTSCAAACTTASCSCTQSNYYWSSTTYQSSPTFAWFVRFSDGGMFSSGKTGNGYVRAVRGGS